MQIFDQNFFKKYPLKYGRKMNLNMRGGSGIRWEKEAISLSPGDIHIRTRIRSFPPFDFATPYHFQIHFSPIFWALQPSRDNQRDHKDQHLNPEGGIF